MPCSSTYRFTISSKASPYFSAPRFPKYGIRISEAASFGKRFTIPRIAFCCMMVYIRQTSFCSFRISQAIIAYIIPDEEYQSVLLFSRAVRDLRSDLPEEDAASPPETDNVRTAFCFRNAGNRKTFFLSIAQGPQLYRAMLSSLHLPLRRISFSVLYYPFLLL